MRTVELEIQDVAFGGKGVGRDQGKAVFVPYVIDGELVAGEVVREKKNFAEADLVEVKDKSPHRVQAPCPYFGRCGGCAYQHMSYTHQLATKRRQVEDVLRRIGGIDHVPVHATIASPEEFGYRNRISVHVQDGVIGFFRRDSRRLIEVEHCPIAKEEVNDALRQLRHNSPRDGHYTLRIGSARRIFSQTNDGVARLLLDLVDRSVPMSQELLIDAYCGDGFFAKRLRHKFVRVIGIDWDRFAIAEARKDATEKENYIAGDVEIELLRLAAVQRTAGGNQRQQAVGGGLGSIAPILPPATLIVDPPATGLTRSARDAIASLAPWRLIYVSCNPSTLARDLKDLSHAFSIEFAQPLDMFPQTAEIEIMVLLLGRTGGSA